MKCAAALLFFLMGVAVTAPARAADLQEPSMEMAALELDKACQSHSSACLAYLGSVRDWMVANPSTFGQLCNANVGPDMLATMYEAHTNQTWIGRAKARDAAVWIFQSMFMCHLQQIAEPGSREFPTRLR